MQCVQLRMILDYRVDTGYDPLHQISKENQSISKISCSPRGHRLKALRLTRRMRQRSLDGGGCELPGGNGKEPER